MTKDQFDINYKWKKFRAKEDTSIKYTYQLGGGLWPDSRTVKAGDIITASSFSLDLDTVSIVTLETLNRIEKNYFDKTFESITY